MWRFKVNRIGDDLYAVDYKGQHIELNADCAGIFYCEYPLWKKTYLPKDLSSIRGKTVLDAGAGAGETALFYFNYGAKKVIGVESSPVVAKLFEQNAKRNNWNVEVYAEPFSLKHLGLQFDFAKIDVEGAESQLLELDRISFPCVVEAHSQQLKEDLCTKFGFRPLARQGGLTTISNCR
jgi:tRNA G37 N-methylase Trm5